MFKGALCYKFLQFICTNLFFLMCHMVYLLCHKAAEHEVTWRHLEDFFNLDRRSAIQMAPKLTEQHIHLPPFTNMWVKLATWVFSHSVAAGTQ